MCSPWSTFKFRIRRRYHASSACQLLLSSRLPWLSPAHGGTSQSIEDGLVCSLRERTRHPLRSSFGYMRDELRGLGRHMGLHAGKTPFRCPPRGREAANLFGSTFGLRTLPAVAAFAAAFFLKSSFGRTQELRFARWTCYGKGTVSDDHDKEQMILTYFVFIHFHQRVAEQFNVASHNTGLRAKVSEYT